MFLITWKYKVKPGFKKKFEFEYGVNGSWNKLFSTSKNYLGSYLYKDSNNSSTYLLVDTWVSEAFYNSFKKENKVSYTTLSSQFEQFYLTEEKIGEFCTVV